MANLITKLTDVGKFAGVERGTMNPTEWSAAIKKKLGRADADISVLYKELKDGKLKNPEDAKPVDATPVKPSDGGADQAAPRTTRANLPDVLPANRGADVITMHPTINMALPAVTIEAPEYHTPKPALLERTLSWCQTWGFGFLSGLVLAKHVFHFIG